MGFDDLKFVVLNKKQGKTKKGGDYYQIVLGCNVGCSITCFVNKEIYDQVVVFDDVTSYVKLSCNENKLSFNLAI